MWISAHLAKKTICWIWLQGNIEDTYRFYTRPVFGTIWTLCASLVPVIEETYKKIWEEEFQELKKIYMFYVWDSGNDIYLILVLVNQYKSLISMCTNETGTLGGKVFWATKGKTRFACMAFTKESSNIAVDVGVWYKNRRSFCFTFKTVVILLFIHVRKGSNIVLQKINQHFLM